MERIVPEGWLLSYMKLAKGLRFPLSFHILCGLFALTTVVGRRAALPRAGFKLYPPTWIMLLGTSGVGKGVSMGLPFKVIRAATDGVPGFLLHRPDTFTRRGLVAECQRVVRETNVTDLEGGILIDEGSAVFTARTGTETIMQFLIKAGELGDVSDFTGYLGAQVLSNFTIGFAITSTLDLLRDSVTPAVFTGGFMHRFLIAHEIQRPETFDDEAEVPMEAVDDLAREARAIRDSMPLSSQCDEEAERLLKAMAMRAEGSPFESASLAGFWNRLPGIVAKVGLGFALSRGSSTVTGEDVVRGERLVRGHLYPPIAELVNELSLPRAKKELMGRADDLYFSGREGMSLNRFIQRLPAHSPAKVKEQIAFLTQLGAIHVGAKNGEQWVWRLANWVEGAQALSGAPEESHELHDEGDPGGD